MRNSFFQRQANAISNNVIEPIKQGNAKMRDEIKLTEKNVK